MQTIRYAAPTCIDLLRSWTKLMGKLENAADHLLYITYIEVYTVNDSKGNNLITIMSTIIICCAYN